MQSRPDWSTTAGAWERLARPDAAGLVIDSHCAAGSSLTGAMRLSTPVICRQQARVGKAGVAAGVPTAELAE